MKVIWNTKYTTVSVYTVITFSACLIVYGIIFNFTVIGEYVNQFLDIIAPILWGLAISYLVNPIMMWLEKRVKKITEKNKPHPKLNRIITLSLSMLIFLACISALAAIILPQVIESITGIINNISTYLNNFQNWIDSILEKYPELLHQVNAQINNIEKTIMEFINNIVPKVGDIMMKITDGTLSFLVSLKDFFIGIIVAVYFLFDKEHFQAQLKKFFCALLPKKRTHTFFRICSQINDSISGFISGKLIDSFIIGCLCFICMTVMKLNFVVLISVIVGVTNIIPFFGPFFGAVPSAILLLVSSPKQVIPFVILIFILQQLDGNIIGPKILGQSTGISAFWVLFAILIGGGLFGFGGMILGVPIFAVGYSLTSEFISYLLENKEMSTATSDYIP
ncbi:MAG: AI-2E family transporter, partial [Ruminococcus sp.]|nr:AI-2E family transporter [Ruminococcus sp.]